MEVGVTDGDDPSRPRDAVHFTQRGYRIGEVLQHLVGVDHVDGLVFKIEVIDVARAEVQVLHSGVGPFSQGHDVLRPVHADHPAGVQQRREVCGDASGSAADVEQVHPGGKMLEEVAGGVGGAARGVRAGHAGVMTVGVDLIAHDRHVTPADRRAPAGVPARWQR